MAVTAQVEGGQLRIPAELGEVLGLRSRGRLLLEPDPDGGFVSRLDLARVGKRLLQRRRVKIATASRADDGWSAPAPEWLSEGRYRIVNYDPRFLLMRSSSEDEAADRAAFWASISDYHEHRTHGDQDDDAQDFSRWFATEVVAPLRPRRVLELGCGGGRNLAHIAEAIDGVEVVGVEVNPKAAEVAQRAVGDRGTIVNGVLYDMPPGRFDVAFTAGVLMHIPHGEVEGVVRAMTGAADHVLHFELHGQARDFDFHRYPRDYGDLYHRLGLDADYRVLDKGDPLNAGESVGHMALLTYGVQ